MQTSSVLCFGFALLPLAVYCLHNPYCSLSCDFGSQTVIHTVCDREKKKCGPEMKCGPDFKVVEMNDKWRQSILNLHNEFRNKVAAGNETRNAQPSATNMNILTYDKELEFLAQCWANACNGNPLVHDSCRSTKQNEHIGQNLGSINSSNANIDFLASMKELTTYWYDEVTIFKSKWVGYTDDRGADIKVGHYTQLVWANTTAIGCAGSYYTTGENNRKWHNFLFVCNYGPGGNYISLPTYDVGPPCSRCPPKTKCNSNYKALCGKSMAVNETSREFVPLFEL